VKKIHSDLKKNSRIQNEERKLLSLKITKKMHSVTSIFQKRNVFVLTIGFILGALFYAAYNGHSASGNAKQGLLPDEDMSIEIPMLPYPEKPWRTSATISARTVASTPFSRFEIHRVRTEDGHIVNDWLWQDERSHVNIMVHLKEENKYLIFKQRKYGFEGPRLAIVGGLFNAGDTPQECAERELLEETGLQAGEMIELGAYRVQANRGGGILHAFLARDCVKSSHQAGKFEADYEQQTVIKLTYAQLRKELMAQKFGEAQHMGVVAIALLHDQERQSG
jgi:ADP-ribose pyrophosphatase